MKFTLLLLALAMFFVGCAATPTPEPTLTPTSIPTAIPKPTQTPTNTALPPTPTTAPTITPPPATNTPIPTTPAPTVTNTRLPVTREPTATPTATEIALKYEAPELIEPRAGDTRVIRRDAFIFKWNPVADLQLNECYQLRLRIVHLADPNRNYGEESYLVESSCNSAIGSGVVQFVVNGRAPAPNYDGLVDEANGKAGGVDSQEYLVQWDVRVVLNQDGKLTPLSPSSAISEFRLLNP